MHIIVYFFRHRWPPQTYTLCVSQWWQHLAALHTFSGKELFHKKNLDIAFGLEPLTPICFKLDLVIDIPELSDISLSDSDLHSGHLVKGTLEC